MSLHNQAMPLQRQSCVAVVRDLRDRVASALNWPCYRLNLSAENGCKMNSAKKEMVAKRSSGTFRWCRRMTPVAGSFHSTSLITCTLRVFPPEMAPPRSIPLEGVGWAQGGGTVPPTSASSASSAGKGQDGCDGNCRGGTPRRPRLS